MNKFLRLGITVIALAFFFGVAETKAQSGTNEILKRMDAHHKSLSSLRANLKMTKHNAQLRETDITQGTTMYLPKAKNRVMYARIDWKEPIVEHIAIIGNEYTLYRPRIPQVIKGKTDNSKNSAKVGGALDFISMSREQLRANYDIKYFGEETISGGTQTFRLQLTPKKATSYKIAEMWVDADGMPVQAKIVENNNDSTTILLSKVEKNIKINASVFTINYPKSIKPISG